MLAKLGEISRPEAVNQVEEYVVNEKGERKEPKLQTAVAAAAPKPETSKPMVTTAAPLKTAVAPATALAPQQAPAQGGALDAITSLFGSPKPAAAAAPVAVATPAQAPAVAAPVTTPVTATATASAAPAGKPFYKRWLGLGSEEPAAAEPLAAPVPAKVPLPPRRQAAAEEAGRKIAMVASGPAAPAE